MIHFLKREERKSGLLNTKCHLFIFLFIYFSPGHFQSMPLQECGWAEGCWSCFFCVSAVWNWDEMENPYSHKALFHWSIEGGGGEESILPARVYVRRILGLCIIGYLNLLPQGWLRTQPTTPSNVEVSPSYLGSFLTFSSLGAVSGTLGNYSTWTGIENKQFLYAAAFSNV